MKQLANKDEIIKAYQDGKSMTALAKEFHTYTTTIKRILERNGTELRHDSKQEGIPYVQDGEKLIEWAKAQDRLVTKSELAKVIGKKKLSPSYFIKYPELGKYVRPEIQNELEYYYQKLYNWLQINNIDYKPNDRTKLKVSVDALLLGEYNNIALQVIEKPKCVSRKKHDNSMKLKQERANEAGVNLIFLNKKQLENLDEIKILLDKLK